MSLVELLVVIAVVLLLIALLGTGVNFVWQTYYDMRCKSNLHRLWQTLHSRESATLPAPDQWIDYVGATEAAPMLICPLDTVGGVAAAEPDPPEINGDVAIISPPASVVFNVLESNTTIHAFVERERVELASNVNCNIVDPGRYDTNYNSGSGVVEGGTVVDAYFVHLDPEGSNRTEVSGTVGFSSDILGIICLDDELDATDGSLGCPQTEYPTGQGSRGFENNAEQITLADDRRSITIHRWKSTFPGENMRVLCESSKYGGGGGGFASYGMNADVPATHPPPTQILLVEYERSIVFVDDLEDFEAMLAPRHLGHVNVLFVEGNVDSMDPEDLHPDVAMKMWRPPGLVETDWVDPNDPW